ncbi:TolB family protein [Polyangium sorediatum]|uniref:PD40 domain-containing protein n=1 Tax=Polyangium sorediatum TaxID=889274 RepID=A0ABT6NNB1_9BACT|nr:PD40 domain-containing protein [Polyangium sorediatum]MDI1429817.1 PD40 domain-containing protein [Polyangium sorediatum]
MRRRFAFLGFVSTLGVAMFAYGCGATGGNSSSGGDGGDAGDWSSGTAQGGQGGDGGCLFNCGSGGNGGTPNVQQLIIAPLNPTLNVVDLNKPTQVFTVKTQDGQDVTNQVTWVYERPDIGDITSATFVPTGNVGGTGVLTAKLNMAEASTNVTVNVKKNINTAGLDPAQMAAFDTPIGPDPGMQIVYPYHDTVFPLGVLAPEVQWNGVGGTETYRLKITEKHMEYVTYFQTGAPARHLMNQADWESIGASGTGAQSDPIMVQLSRLAPGGGAYAPTSQVWHVAQGRVRGAVYYWELPGVCGGNSNGRILKIKPDSATPEEFFNPGGCWGCHTVSRDGKTMMATLDGSLPFPQITIDLTQAPAQYGAIPPGSGLGGTFSAFNHSSDKILVSNDAASNPSNSILRIVNAAGGGVLNANVMGNGCGEPAWSPDGNKVAAICGLGGGGWVFDASSGYLATGDVAADGITVGNVHPIVQQAGSPGRPAYPSFTSDSQYIAFGRPTQGSRSTGNGDLWLVKNDGGELKKLAIASSDNKSFNPVFAPQRAGGYYWLVFVSRRDYGNTLVSTNRQQLWMTAIDDPPTAGDPSHPPFYMRGQEGCGLSENAYMAQEPCKEQGQGCVTGADCCGGQCVKDPASGAYICGEPPPPGSCSETGNACTTKADCCNPVDECIDGFCAQKPPK